MRQTIQGVVKRPYLLPGLVFRKFATQLRRRRDLATALAILPAIPPQAGLPPPASWRIQRVEWPYFSSTGVAVILVGTHGQPPCAVLKLPHTLEGLSSLRRQARTLAVLRADPRLQAWVALVAQTLAAGRHRGQPYIVETVLPGHVIRPLLLGAATRRRLQAAAAAAIGELHAGTAGAVRVDPARLQRWVDTPLGVLQGVVDRLPAAQGHRAALARLRAELYATLAGQVVATSWVHGDFWLGNLLVDVDEVTVVGIVDWERAAADELPLHDLLHLLLFTRQQVQQWNEADVVAALTGGIRWTAAEQALLRAAQAALPGQVLAERPMVLLYWLRHMVATLSLLPEYTRDRAYLASHVECVLRYL